MRRIIAFIVIFAVLFGVVFGCSIALFPEWLNQPNWPKTLAINILITGLIIVAEEISKGAISFLFEDKDLKERLIFLFGNKYKIISKKLDEFSEFEISKEKRSRKYIPNIFVESTKIKEKLRYFSQPYIFFNKIVEQTDRFLQSAYIINLLKQIHYPIDEPAYPGLRLKPGHLGSLRKNIQKYQTYLDRKKSLTNILIKEHNVGIKPEYISKIPPEFIYLYKYRYVNLQHTWPYDDVIEEAKADLNLLNNKFIVIKSMAGHGKTNLICDFVEYFLLKKRQKCLFISARSLNHLDEHETMEQAIARTIFTESGFQFSDIVRLADFDNRVGFLFILIDGINEHKNLPLFSAALEQFAQRCSSHKIKILLTCRSEYFEDRFGNLLHIYNSSVIDMDERKYLHKIPDVHIEALLSGYFSEFKVKLSVTDIDSDIMDVLNTDKLLLRIFCEAYENEQPAEFLKDLFKLEIFYKYYEKKIEAIHGLDNCLNEIISIMIAQNQFSNIQIAMLSDVATKVIENTIYESVIIKKDIIINPDLAFAKFEVINFVYDEFRDFLIASKVLIGWDGNNQSSKDLVQNLTAPGHPVAEGLQRYLCLWSIKNKKDDLLDYLSSQGWFGSIFIDSVFDTPDSLLSGFVFTLLKRLFDGDSTNALHILWLLHRRANTEYYHHLNIEFLFDCLNEFNDAEYKCIVVDALTQQYNFGETQITHLCLQIVQAFKEKKVSEAAQKNLTKFVAYLVGVVDYRHYHYRDSELGEHPADETLHIIVEEIGVDLVRDALNEVILSSKAEYLKSRLGSLLRMMGEE